MPQFSAKNTRPRLASNGVNKSEIIPTVVPNSLADIERAQSRFAPFSSLLHIDAADGVFASNATWMPDPDEKLPHADAVLYEAHLMVDNPLLIGVAYARAGARRIIGHVEAFSHAESAQEAFAMWKGAGAQEVGVAILLATPVDALLPYIDLCDSVLFMTIATIGVQGLPFDDRSVERIKEFHKRHAHVVIAADGGVSESNIKRLSHAGASRFSVGSTLSKSKEPELAYQKLLKLAGA